MLILEKTISCGQMYDLRNEDEPRDIHLAFIRIIFRKINIH